MTSLVSGSNTWILPTRESEVEPLAVGIAPIVDHPQQHGLGVALLVVCQRAAIQFQRVLLRGVEVQDLLGAEVLDQRQPHCRPGLSDPQVLGSDAEDKVAPGHGGAFLG